MTPYQLTTLILAGGKSSRMGQDKALMSWDGIPMLKRVYQVAVELGTPVYVMAPYDRYSDLLPPDCQWLEESCPGEGPLVALAQGLEQLSRDWILLLGCDLPLLRADLLRGWIDELDRLPPSILAAVPRQEVGWEPLCGFYRKNLQSQLQQFLDGGGRSFQNLLPQIPVQPLLVGEEEAEMLHNCNTPEDLIDPATS